MLECVSDRRDQMLELPSIPTVSNLDIRERCCMKGDLRVLPMKIGLLTHSMALFLLVAMVHMLKRV